MEKGLVLGGLLEPVTPFRDLLVLDAGLLLGLGERQNCPPISGQFSTTGLQARRDRLSPRCPFPHAESPASGREGVGRYWDSPKAGMALSRRPRAPPAAGKGSGGTGIARKQNGELSDGREICSWAS